MKIIVKDLQAPVKCNHWGKYTVMVLLLLLAGFSAYVAIRNSRPVCNDLRARQLTEYSRTLECVYDLGDIQEDQADVIIIRSGTDYIR